MLEPHGRTLLFDILKPPEGHVLDAAIATTYTLDLLALLTAPVAFSLFDVDDHRELLDQESLTLLESLRRYADKITVFCQSGQIGLPKAQFPQLEFLEQSVIACRARVPGAAFHPKTWLLRYLRADGGVTYRFACLTRNLTFDRCWDTVLTLEGPLLDRQNTIAVNRPLADFVSALPDRATNGTSVAIRQRIELMQTEVRKVAFEVPEGFDSFSFHPAGIDVGRAFPFQNRPGKMLIVSPFVSDGGLTRLTKGREGTLLVSRPETLESPNCLFDGIETFYVLSRGTEDESENQTDAQIDLTRGLHAKCYVIDAGWKAHVFTGSANATEAAFKSNVEFLVELVGSKSRFGIEALFRREDARTCLGDLLEEFKPDPKPIDEEEEGRRAAIERMRQLLADITFVAHVLPVGDRFSVRLVSGEPLRIDTGVTVKCWPVTLGKGWALDVRPGSTELTFESLSFEALTAFIAFEVAIDGSARSEVFVINVPLEGAPPDRRDRLFRLFIKDRQRLLRFLMLLLADDAELADAMGAKIYRRGLSNDAEASESYGALLESLLRTLHRSPERLDAVARLVEDVKRQPEAQELLPPGFERIWDPIWSAKQGSKA